MFKFFVMKFLVAILLTALLSFVSGLYVPWWGIAIAAFLVNALIRQEKLKSFFSGFCAVFLLWGGLSWWIDSKSNGALSQKIAQILPLGGSVFSLVMLTAFTGALVAGFAALAGSYLKDAFQSVQQ
jgi:hypothetical protein